jgi:hypothetical protein
MFWRTFEMTDVEQANSNEGADPSADLKKENPGETTTADLISGDDPHKAQKLAEAGRDIDPDEGSY